MIRLMIDIMVWVPFVHLVQHLSLASLDMDLVIEVPCVTIPTHVCYICPTLVYLCQPEVCHCAIVISLLLVGITHDHDLLILVDEIPDIIPVPVSVNREFVIPLE